MRALSSALVVVLAGPLLLAGCSGGGSTPAAADRTAHARTAPSPSREAGVTALLAVRARAVLHDDPAAYLATVDPQAPAAFRAAERSAAQALSSLHFDAWQLSLGTGGDLSALPGRLAAHHADDAWLPATTLRYRWHGGDGTPSASRLGWTYVRRGTHWYVGADDDATSGQTDREIWDFGPVGAATGASTLVLFHRDKAAEAGELVTDVDRAVPAVTKVWGPGWPRRVVVLVPSTGREFEALARSGSDLAGDAAVESGTVGSGNGTRIVVNPQVLFASAPLARQIVLTHEVTHVASAAATGPNMPTWLIEGTADDVAFGAAGVEPATGATALLQEVRGQGAPDHLPTDADFDASGSARDLAYSEAWIACRFVARSAGDAGLVRLYRLVGQGTDVSTALQAVLHEDTDAFTAAWQADLRSLAA